MPDQQIYFDLESALAHLRDESVSISPLALFAFSGATAHTLERFAHTWQDIPQDRRERIAQALVEVAEESIEADFGLLCRYLLNDENPQVRAHAVNGLWEDDDPRLIKVLVGLLRSDPAAIVRAAAAQALGSFAYLAEIEELSPDQATRVREALLSIVRNSEEDIEVRRRAVEAVSFFGGEEIRGIIASAYENDDPKMRISALFAMGRSADTYWRGTVLSELDSPDGAMRFEAARASGELELKNAVPRLVQLLEDPDREVQSAAISALGQIGGDMAREALDEVAQSDDEVNAEAAVDALEELDFTEGTNLLMLDMDLDRDSVQELETDGDSDGEDEDKADDDDLTGDDDVDNG